jgi:6-pyruvoyltetrahydropterin/6-carboxytetrahydropterin synthase
MVGMPTCCVTRRAHFNAAHRLYNPARSEAWNAEMFGVCANPNYHGHNYEIDVTVDGVIDPDTGYVIDINVLKRLVEEKLLAHLDHKNLNLDVPHFRDVIPTAENIAVYCWQVLAPVLPAGTLRRIRLWETPRNYVDYEGR